MRPNRQSTWSGRHPLQDQLNQVLGHCHIQARNDVHADAANATSSQWLPRVDIKEEDNRFVIFADLPGMEPSEIEIQMDRGILSMKGERKAHSAGDSGYTRVERAHGVFVRRFELPETADQEGISAAGRNGVLEISIPKRLQSTPRRIVVQ